LALINVGYELELTRQRVAFTLCTSGSATGHVGWAQCALTLTV